MIKKFKGGNIHLKMESKDKDITKTDIENGQTFYDGECFQNDIYIMNIEGYDYIVDFNRERVYDLPHNHIGMFFEDIAKCEKIILYPYSQRKSKELIEKID